MTPTPARTRPHLLGAATLGAVLVLAGCADQAPGDEADPAPGETAADTGAANTGTADTGATTPGTATAETVAAAAEGTTVPSGPAETATAAPSPEPEPVTVSIGATGDLLPHSSVLESAQENADGDGDYEFSPMFAEVAELIRGSDISLCHLETPLSPDNTNLTQSPVLSFSSPRELARDVADTGWDGCDFASNHTMDRGVSGLADTEEVVRDAGLGYAGPTAFEERVGQAEVYQTPQASVAHLAYTYTLPNSGSSTTSVPAEAPWLGENLWPLVGAEGILGDARKARAEGADFVVVSMHWGAEYQTEPTDRQRGLAEKLLGSDAVDLILGTHAHVIQPCETINGKHVLYGMGNFVSNQSPDTTNGGLRSETQEGMVARITLTRNADGEVTSRFAMRPTRVDLDGHVVEPASPQSHPETYQRTMETMRLLQDDGCGVQPLP